MQKIIPFEDLSHSNLIVDAIYKGGTKGNWKVTITYGKPLDFSQYKGSKDKEVLDKVTEEIMSNIIELAK